MTRYTAAPQESIDAVRGFIRQHLKAAGYAERWGERATLAVNRDFLHVRLPVDVANSMFGVRLHRFVPTHRTNGEWRRRTARARGGSPHGVDVRC